MSNVTNGNENIVAHAGASGTCCVFYRNDLFFLQTVSERGRERVSAQSHEDLCKMQCTWGWWWCMQLLFWLFERTISYNLESTSRTHQSSNFVPRAAGRRPPGASGTWICNCFPCQLRLADIMSSLTVSGYRSSLKWSEDYSESLKNGVNEEDGIGTTHKQSPHIL